MNKVIFIIAVLAIITPTFYLLSIARDYITEDRAYTEKCSVACEKQGYIHRFSDVGRELCLCQVKDKFVVEVSR